MPVVGAVTDVLMDCTAEAGASGCPAKLYVMLEVERPLHVGACACNWKVNGTVELFVGVVMTTLCDETLMFKSVSQNAPALPHAFTRSRWLPAAALTF